MNNRNKLIIAAAGSGKTTFLMNEAMKVKKGDVLFTTYTRENASEIKQKFISKHKCIPKFVTIQTWSSFLLQHGAKPYQGSYNEQMFEYDIKGLNLVHEKSGYKVDKSGNPIETKGRRLYWGEKQNFKKHFFNGVNKIFSDKLSKFVFKTNECSGNKVIDRISNIYQYIFIDEAQDLAGYDLEIIKLLLKRSSNVVLVADPRQVTYLTHREAKHKKYNGKIKDFINEKCKGLIDIDESLLSVSHRNNQKICDFSALLWPDLPKIKACECCRDNTNLHIGIWLVRKKSVKLYLDKYRDMTQLRWNKRTKVCPKYPVFNFGKSKGKTFERVIIYPTEDMVKWVFKHNARLENETRAKFYVAITRAKHSVAIVVDDNKIDKAWEGI